LLFRQFDLLLVRLYNQSAAFVIVPSGIFLESNDKDQILVFDVAGSHVADGIFHLSSVCLSAWDRLAGVTAPRFSAVFEALEKSLLPFANCVTGVSVAIPNPFDLIRGVSYMRHKHQPLYGINLRPGSAESLRCHPGSIHFLNDAAVLLIGELEQGAAVGSRRCAGVTLGTGVGCSFAIHQDIVTSGAGVPGGREIWNLPYRTGIVEDVVSSNAIARE
jgi:glucokinase